MPISDKLKCTTLLRAGGKVAFVLDKVADALEAIRVLHAAASPDTTGTPLEGQLANVSAWIDEVRAVADHPVAVAMRAQASGSHQMKALGEWPLREHIVRVYCAAGGK